MIDKIFMFHRNPHNGTLVLTLFNYIAFWRETKSFPGTAWFCGYDCYMHCNDSLLGLIWSVLTEFKNDKHLCM